jgi:hypothetical protein
MRRGILIGLLLLLAGWGRSSEIILACGQNSGNNFNGWELPTYAQFDQVNFTENSIHFYSFYGGNFPVTLERKIEISSDYESITALFNFNAVSNCEIKDVTIYLSENGETWEPLQSSRNNAASYVRLTKKYTHVRAIANVAFGKDAILTCDYFKLEGTKKLFISATPEPLPLLVEEEKLFTLFHFQNRVNVETQSAEVYEVQITSISGKILHREKYINSVRIDIPDYPSGIYVVTIIQGPKIILSQKITK